MDKSTERAYFVKELYISAGRRLLNDNYEYYAGTVNYDKTDAVTRRLLKLAENRLCVALEDNTGCCENYIMQKITDFSGGKDIVFAYTDDTTDNKLMAVFIYKKDLFIFSNRQNLHPRLLTVNLSHCYSNPDRRKYTPGQYVEMAGYYFEKSEYIDKELSL